MADGTEANQIMEATEFKTGNALKEFLIEKSCEDIRFAHLMFWCILSSMDDTQSIQMSRHSRREVWDVLDMLVRSCDNRDNQIEYKEKEFFRSFKNLPQNVPKNEERDGASDTGGSDSFNYGHVENLESHARLVRFD